jgi:ketosteroid isomerase-like protein
MDREEWARGFFGVVDSRKPTEIAAFMTQDVRLQMANMPASTGVEALKAAFAAAATRFASITHVVQGVWGGTWEGGDVVSVEAIVRYGLADGRVVELPCTSTLRLRGDRIADYRIFIDPGPAFADRADM